MFGCTERWSDDHCLHNKNEDLEVFYIFRNFFFLFKSSKIFCFLVVSVAEDF